MGRAVREMRREMFVCMNVSVVDARRMSNEVCFSSEGCRHKLHDSFLGKGAHVRVCVCVCVCVCMDIRGSQF